MAQKKLVRSSNKVLAGVCGGIAEFFGLDITLVRVLYVLLSFFSAAFPGLLLYIILMLLMPEGDNKDKRFDDAEVVK
jgi:phage shock protein C